MLIKIPDAATVERALARANTVAARPAPFIKPKPKVKTPDRTELDAIMARINAAPSYTVEAVELHIMRGTCSCGRQYQSPNRKLLVRMRNKSELRHVAVSDTDIPREAPRELIFHTVDIPACEHCFDGAADPRQLSLFPQEFPTIKMRVDDAGEVLHAPEVEL